MPMTMPPSTVPPPRGRRTFLLPGACLVLLALALPWLASEYWLRAILIPVVILSLAAMGQNILMGYCGQVSLGGGGFMAVGAYTAYNVFVRLEGMPVVVAILAGGVCAALVGLVFGLPSLRIRGLYLGVATLALQFFADWTFLRIKWFTQDSASGLVSVPAVKVLGLPIESPAAKYLFCLSFLGAFALLARHLVGGAIGREWMAVRDMEVAATALGIRPRRAKLTAFAVSSFFIGVAGALWGFVYLGSWEPAAFSIDRSFQLLFMTLIGGLGALSGGLYGAAFLVVLPILLDQVPRLFGLEISSALSAHLSSMIFGGLIVFFLIVEPKGLSQLARLGLARWRRRQAGRAAVR